MNTFVYRKKLRYKTFFTFLMILVVFGCRPEVPHPTQTVKINTSTPKPSDTLAPTLTPAYTTVLAPSATLQESHLDMLTFTYLVDGFLYNDSGMQGNEAIYMIYSDGSGFARLIEVPEYSHDPAWSPNGSRLAFLSPDANVIGSYLYILDIESNQTDGVEIDTGIFSWSPDGKMIAISENFVPVINAPTWNSIYLIPINNLLPELVFRANYLSVLKWSPTDPNLLLIKFVEDEHDSIYILYTDRTLRRIPTTNEPEWGLLSWDPTGQWIIYGTNCVSDSYYGFKMINVDTGQEEYIPTEGCPSDPAWSPDGELFAYNSAISPGASCRLYITQVVDGEVIYVTPEGFCGYSLAWSSDSRFLAFKSDSDDINKDGYSLYVYSMETGELTCLVPSLVGLSRPSWRP